MANPWQQYLADTRVKEKPKPKDDSAALAAIEKAYRNVLGRGVDSSGRGTYLEAWHGGMNSQAKVEADLRNSEEYLNRRVSNKKFGEGGGGPNAGGGFAGAGSYVDRQVDAIQYADKYAASMDKIFKEYAPNQYKLPEELAGTLSDRLAKPGAVPDWLREQYLGNLRGAYAAAGMRRSSNLAEAEPQGLSRLGLELYQADMNSALSLASRAPQVQYTVPNVSDYYGADLGYMTSNRNISEQARQFDVGQENQMFQWARGPNNVSNAGQFNPAQATPRTPNPFVQFGGELAGTFFNEGIENFFDTGRFFHTK